MSDTISWLHWPSPAAARRAARRPDATTLPRGYRLRPFAPADADAYLRLATAILGEPVTHRYLARLIPTLVLGSLLVIEHRASGLVVATGAARPLADPAPRVGTPPVELINVGVDPAHRRRGLARAVCGAVVARLLTGGFPEIRVAPERDNGAAGALYRSLGFRETR